tara:strand:+ start:2985 stop:3260 length:276 start_codon:yes stop_codon:yes gene_type:complete
VIVESPQALGDIVLPLAQLCEAKGLRWRWEAVAEGGTWRANVIAGHADANWNRTGALPCWTALADSDAAALKRAVEDAIFYWESIANSSRE